MKTRFFAFVSCAVLLMAAGCKKEEPKVEPESIIGEKSAPAWTNPEEYDLSTSMTAVVKIDMTKTYEEKQLTEAGYEVTESDELAAFCDSVCLGTGELVNGLYFLYITAPENEGNVKIKYYSSKLKNIFVSTESFPFRNDASLGSVQEPYAPKFEVEK